MVDGVIHKSQYRTFCAEQKELPLFLNDWWLDAVCAGDNWNACLSKNKDGKIQGVLPYFLSKHLGFTVSKMPDLTPSLGPYLIYPSKLDKQEAKLRFQKKVLRDLIHQLPVVAYFAQKCTADFQNALPFYWDNYKIKTRFTHILRWQEDLQVIFENLKGSVRTEIRKAKEEIEVEETEDLALFYELQRQSFARQGLAVPFDLSFLQRIDQALSERAQRSILIAKDKKAQIHAGIYLCWDKRKVYNLLQGANPKYTTSGAIKLLLWNGIQFAHAQNADFDFEGGMMPNIEAVFSSFGAEQAPYFKIYKGRNRFFQLLAAIKNG